MQKKKIAIIGLGKIGLFHLSILRNIPQVEIVGLVDDKPAVQKTVRGMGVKIPFFPNIETLVAKEKIDGAFACVPPVFNPSIAQACIPKGIALFTEKPMAANLDGVKKMMELLNASKSPPANSVGYMVAFYPIHLKALEMIRSGILGEIEFYSGSMLLGEVFQKQEGWRQNPKISGGGAVAVLGSHLLYLVQAFLGMPKTIQAKTTHLYSTVEDEAQIKFSHESFSGDLKISWSEKGYSDMAIVLEIKGKKANLTLEKNRIRLQEKGKDSSETIYPWDLAAEPCEGLKVRPAREGYASQDLNFIDSLESKNETLVSWKEGFKVQRLIEGIYKSAASSESELMVPE